MRNNYLKLISSFLLVILFVMGCQKQINVKPANAGMQSESIENDDRDGNECRLVFVGNNDPTGNYDFKFHYNYKGLADQWDIENDGLFTQEYDEQRKLKKSTFILNGQVSYTIGFSYKGNKVVKETFYIGTGTDVWDEDFFSYNAQGKIIKVQSFMDDWVALTTYTPEGNISSSQYSFGSTPVYSAFFKYNRHFKNPYLAVPGIDNAFPFYAPAELFSSKWLFAGITQEAYDENGNPYLTIEFDPSKTVWQAGPRNYPSSVTCFDLLSAGWFTTPYEFENCGEGRDNNWSNSQITVPATASGARKMNPMMLLKRDPSKSMKQQVQEFRQQLNNFKKSVLIIKRGLSLSGTLLTNC